MTGYREQPQEKREEIKNSVGRMTLVGVSVLLQLGWVVGLATRLTEYFAVVEYAVGLLAFLLVLYICEEPLNSAYKISWIVMILMFPVFGVCVYSLFGKRSLLLVSRKRLEAARIQVQALLEPDPEAERALAAQSDTLAGQVHYLQHKAGYPVYRNTDVTYYSDTVEAIRAQWEAVSQADRFILMEYHAIEYSEHWRRLEDVLAEKAASGVDVRVLYDDMGSVGFVNSAFVRRLRSRGIRCQVFNPMVPLLNMFMNHRDHRKMTIVDGKVAFTGGFNLADEYFNLTHPYGHWKDSGIRLEGDAVRSMTDIFFQMWNAGKEEMTDVRPFLEPQPCKAREEGFVVPYGDSPLDDELTGENVYLNLIKGAKRYLYISTPYLIISDEMERELSLAAGRGVDVRICTPGIPDKRVVYRVTRSNYPHLLWSGVKIYEYTPGFLHQKVFLADDTVAVVGTVNLDFRSLYLNFENACWFTNSSAVLAVRRDFEEIFPVCREVTGTMQRKETLLRWLYRQLLRLLSPML